MATGGVVTEIRTITDIFRFAPSGGDDPYGLTRREFRTVVCLCSVDPIDPDEALREHLANRGQPSRLLGKRVVVIPDDWETA
jgi:hypothetical protein